MKQHAIERQSEERINWVSSIPFFLVHAACFLAIVTGVSTRRRRAVRRPLLRPHVVHHRRLPPLLLPPQLPHQPGLPVRARVRRLERRPEGPPLVGVPSPRSPPLQRYPRGPALATQGLLVEPRRLDPVRQEQRLGRRLHPRLQQVPRAALHHQARLDRAVGAGHRVVLHRRLVWRGGRLPVVDRAAVARHLHRELAGPRDGPAPLRHHRHQPQLCADRPVDRGRGVAQQPPLLPGVCPQRLLLVGVRHHVLRAQGAQLGRTS